MAKGSLIRPMRFSSRPKAVFCFQFICAGTPDPRSKACSIMREEKALVRKSDAHGIPRAPGFGCSIASRDLAHNDAEANKKP